jgi:hypothetical protein
MRRLAADENFNGDIVVDEVLPDGDGVAPATERLGDQLAIGLTRAVARHATSAPSAEGRWISHPNGRFGCPPRIVSKARRRRP